MAFALYDVFIQRWLEAYSRKLGVICKYCATLWEGLEHPWILLSAGASLLLRDDCILVFKASVTVSSVINEQNHKTAYTSRAQFSHL